MRSGDLPYDIISGRLAGKINGSSSLDILARIGCRAHNRGGFYPRFRAVLVRPRGDRGRPRRLPWWGTALAVLSVCYRLGCAHRNVANDLREISFTPR